MTLKANSVSCGEGRRVIHQYALGVRRDQVPQARGSPAAGPGAPGTARARSGPGLRPHPRGGAGSRCRHGAARCRRLPPRSARCSHGPATGITGRQLGHELLQAVALRLGLDPPGNAERGFPGQQDQVAGRQRDEGGQPRALGAQLILDHLHEDRIALPKDIPDVGFPACFGRRAAGWRQHIGGVEKARCGPGPGPRRRPASRAAPG